MAEINETLCEAIDIIAKAVVANVSYDRTVLCKVIDDSKYADGEYIVSENNITLFQAVSNDTSYRNGDNVYVLIPQGDQNQDKLITGRKIDTATQPYTYKKPFITFADTTGNLTGETIRGELLANKITKDQVSGEDMRAPTSQLIWTDTNSYSGYTRLGLRAGFKTKLNPFHVGTSATEHYVITGDYGLRLKLYSNPEGDPYILELNQNDMNGDIYNFNTYFPQEKVFNIENIEKINKITVEFYQNGNFISDHGEPSPVEGLFGADLSPNLFVNDIYIAFGYDTEDVGTDKIEIYTPSDLRYEDGKTDAENNKVIGIRWIHKGEDGVYKVVPEENDLEYEVNWYTYRLGRPAADSYCGSYWVKIENSESDKKSFNVNFQPLVSQPNQQVKCILIHNNNVLRSEVLTFSNTKEVINMSSIEALQALTVECEDDFKGKYFLYGQTGAIKDQAQAQKIRNLIPYFKEHSQQEDSVAEELTKAKSIQWVVPATNTMIRLVDSTIEPDENGYYNIVCLGDEETNTLAPNRLEYRIDSQYSQSNTNNTIRCNVNRGDIIYTTFIDLQFGVSTIENEDYIFSIFCDKPVVLNDLDGVTVTASLMTPQGKSVELYKTEEIDGENKTISNVSWSWKAEPLENKPQLLEIKENESSPTCLVKPIESTEENKIEIGENYHILQATTIYQEKELIAYLPIAIAADKNHYLNSGVTEIIYSTSGELIDYEMAPYKIYSANKIENPVPENIEWTIYNPIESDKDYLPQMTEDWCLKPLNTYIDGTCEYLCVLGEYTVDEKKIITWAQPILIKKINATKGETTVIKSPTINNSIYTSTITNPIVSAGKKDTSGAYTGIVLGECKEEKDGEESISITGLYGYKDGVQTFGFKEDGTAFIGGPNKSRLIFDGTESIIKSNSEEGIILDFDDGSAKFGWLKNKDNEQEGILIDSQNDDFALQIGENFKVDWGGNVIIDGSSVVQGDLEVKGKIIAKNNNNSNIWEIGADGQTSFSNLTASGGTIGGCKIDYDINTKLGGIQSNNYDAENKIGWRLDSKGNVYLPGWKPSVKKVINLSLSGVVPVKDENGNIIATIDLSELKFNSQEITSSILEDGEELNLEFNINNES